MLKALELVGFKSFADKTRFDFPDGITIVVGPNGSGKSNVVDAVKWVLGAQSAKSLRGSEMTDVIFKGSAEGGRKPANSAEVMLVLDNRSRLLPIDADEVNVSRRVYRSGEGEYSVNGQPRRLKDIRDMFRGTGVGVDAYSLIEQGKVDRLLQSSPKDRRAIFEEAAGISRFKAKKAEAERRLQRVDQNLLRLGDIVDEVGKRLSTLMSQAMKAQRYREMTQQLRQSRTQLGLLDLANFNHSIASIEEQARSNEQSRTQVELQLKEHNQKCADETEELQSIRVAKEGIHVRLALEQQNLARAQADLALSQQRKAELETEIENLVERISTLEHRASLSADEIDGRQAELQSLELSLLKSTDQLAIQAREDEQCTIRVHEAKQELIELRNAEFTAREDLTHRKSELAGITSQIEQLVQVMEHARLQKSEVESRLSTLVGQLDIAAQNLDHAEQKVESALTAKSSARVHGQATHELLRGQQKSLADVAGRLHGVRERLSVLTQLEEQFTNAGRGGQQLIRNAQSLIENNLSMASGLQSIRGLVADLIQSELHLAPLVDVALGSLSDAIVLIDGQLVDWINDGRLTAEGRVTLLRLDRLPTRRTGEKIQLDGLRGVIGRADRLVKYESDQESLVRSLLGTTWFVESLTTALNLSHLRGAGLRFVTAECQLIDSDGSITIGSLQSGLGLVSRRSEMQSAHDEIRSLESSCLEMDIKIQSMQEVLKLADQAIQDTENHWLESSRELTSARLELESLEKQRQQEQESLDAQNQWMADSTSTIGALQLRFAELIAYIQRADHNLAAVSAKVQMGQQQLEQLELELNESQSSLMKTRIEHARLDQRVLGGRLTVEQLLQDANERATHVELAKMEQANIVQKLDQTIGHIQELELQHVFEGSQAIILLESQLDEHRALMDGQQAIVNESVKLRDQTQRQLERLTDKRSALQEERSRIEAQVEDLRRLYGEEYQIDLDSDECREQATQMVDLDRAKIESQLTHLRQEIATAGSVNMEALSELDALQSRHDRLAGQRDDLVEAKQNLILAMERIDLDSQQLFLTTVESIRINFQQLYRKSFGGGSADIILENALDPNSGIEIVATPPGKTTFNNSLLSGGEKALTAVALIMAFFQYRPSPFCILDEVDAPFDEANIGRFVTVLNEFLDSTKFIVVTHSKKTMTVANTIYGITMQESGVSRQVAVKFEEVTNEADTAPSSRAA